MSQQKRALNKLKKYGFKTQQLNHDNTRYLAFKGEWHINLSFTLNGCLLSVSSSNEWDRLNHNPQHDNFTKFYHDNLTQAIRYIDSQMEEK